MPAGSEMERQAAAVVMTGLPGTSMDDETRAVIECGVRSFILFGRNIADREQVRALCDEIRALAGPDALIAIDHEGGRVNRLREVATDWPSPMGWAATGDEALVRQASTVMAQELAALGINLNFAPVADLLGDYRNPVLSNRCFSDDPATVARYVTAFVEGHRAARVASTAKHFPGHGHTPTDSHVELPTAARTPEQLLREDVLPFRAAIGAGVDCLMVSHVWYPHLDDRPTPATLSAAVAELARRDLDYHGLIITDSLDMGAIRTRMSTGEAVVGALTAGADMVMVSHSSESQSEALSAIAGAVRDGILSTQRLDEAEARIERLRGSAVSSGRMPETGAGLAEEIARRGVTLVRNDGALLPIRPAQGRLGVVSFSAPRGTLVEDAAALPPLAAALARRIPSLTHVAATSESASDAVAAELDGVDIVIAGSARAAGQIWQADIVNRLLDAGKTVVGVALADPFDILAYPRVPAFVAAYSDVPASVEAAAAVICGERAPPGRLPVEIPGLYPRFHGLVS
jgi:beta-N-acetylhexosaminidase